MGERTEAALASLPALALADADGEAVDDPPTTPMPVTVTPSAVSLAPTGVAAPTSSGGAHWLGVVYSM